MSYLKTDFLYICCLTCETRRHHSLWAGSRFTLLDGLVPACHWLCDSFMMLHSLFHRALQLHTVTSGGTFTVTIHHLGGIQPLYNLLDGLRHDKIYRLGDAYLARYDWLRSGVSIEHLSQSQGDKWAAFRLRYTLTHIHSSFILDFPQTRSFFTMLRVHEHMCMRVTLMLSSCIPERRFSVIQATSGQHRNVQSFFKNSF